MKAKLKGLPSFEILNRTFDGLGLLMAIKSIIYKFNSQQYLCHALHESMRRIYIFQQGKQMTASTYLEQFNNMIDIIEAIGCNVGLHEAVITEVASEESIDLNTITDAQRDSLSKTAKKGNWRCHLY